jgi:hypothetical protein
LFARNAIDADNASVQSSDAPISNTCSVATKRLLPYRDE